jgi:hypothetical protein
MLINSGKIVLQVGFSDQIIQNHQVHYSSLLYLYKSLRKIQLSSPNYIIQIFDKYKIGKKESKARYVFVLISPGWRGN